MSKIEVNEIDKQSGSTVTVGGSGTDVVLGTCGQTVSLGTGASQSGFCRTGTVNWQTTIKTTTFTAANGEGYFCNTSSGGFTVNLPAGTAGSILAVKDYLMTFDTGNLTITPNGSQLINGVSGNFVINTEGLSLTLIYADDTRGWLAIHDSTTSAIGSSFITATGGTVTTVCTNFKVHTFTGPGTFCVSGGAGPLALVDTLIVAGGGGSAGGSWGGGGGAGGFRESKTAPVSGCWSASPLVSSTPLGPFSPGAYPVTVGAGGTGQPCASGNDGTPGSTSTFSCKSSAGGGGSEKYASSTAAPSGGSGAGGPANTGTGGAGTTPPVSPPQGQAGGGAMGCGGGGGGGAGGVGTTRTPPAGTTPLAGGAGVATNINSAGPTTFAAGGKGIGNNGSGVSPPNAAANTGDGGHGPVANPSPGGTGGNGGSGIVMIRYKFQ